MILVIVVVMHLRAAFAAVVGPAAMTAARPPSAGKLVAMMTTRHELSQQRTQRIFLFIGKRSVER